MANADWQWDPTLYSGTAAHYAQGRLPYQKNSSATSLLSWASTVGASCRRRVWTWFAHRTQDLAAIVKHMPGRHQTLVSMGAARTLLPQLDASVRVVPLPISVVDALGHHLVRHPTNSLVFTNASGAPLRRSAFWTAWNRAIRQSGLPTSASTNYGTTTPRS